VSILVGTLGDVVHGGVQLHRVDGRQLMQVPDPDKVEASKGQRRLLKFGTLAPSVQLDLYDVPVVWAGEQRGDGQPGCLGHGVQVARSDEAEFIEKSQLLALQVIRA
jgi:hypothetical protein